MAKYYIIFSMAYVTRSEKIDHVDTKTDTHFIAIIAMYTIIGLHLHCPM